MLIITCTYMLIIKSRRLKALLACIFAGTVLFAYVYLLPLLNLQTDLSYLERKEYLSIGLERFFNSFLLLGTGSGSFNDFSLHNLYAEILFKFGVLIFAGYLLLYVGILKNLYVIMRRATDKEMRRMAEGFFVALCAYSFGCTADSSRLTDCDSWIIIALSLVVINLFRIRKRERVAGTEMPPDFRQNGLLPS